MFWSLGPAILMRIGIFSIGLSIQRYLAEAYRKPQTRTSYEPTRDRHWLVQRARRRNEQRIRAVKSAFLIRGPP